MNRKLQILASFFLLAYISFLGHDLIVHNHQHAETALDHVCLIQDAESVNDLAKTVSQCKHIAEDCHSCEHDQSLHKQLVFAKDFKSDPHLMVPFIKIRPLSFSNASTNAFTRVYYPDESWLYTSVLLRAPPSLA